MRDYSEDALVEQPAIALFQSLGWQYLNCMHETLGEDGTLGRETRSEVVLLRRLRPALRKFNPSLPGAALDQAVAELTRDRSTQTLVAANRDLYRLSKDGVPVRVRAADGAETDVRVRVIDWDDPANNDFFLASQLWVTGEMYTRRADLLGFVNGLPLVFVELKAVHRHLQHAFDDNLRDYKSTIPQLFWYNAFIILSNGTQTRAGSLTAGWEHFFEWKKVAAEDDPPRPSLETTIAGMCAPARLLDLVENFILFTDVSGALVKLVARNHQVLGVNNAIAALRSLRQNQGRLGVFWHTQGAGKSYSMVFFSQKVLRKLPGNWTFLIVTDRQELDDQIYKTFAAAGAVTEQEVHAESGEQLRRLLREDHRNIFTLIHKFQTDPGGAYPVLSERADIIVITDEAHRSQYDTLALNMRTALPNAAFIAFTGTPLIVGEEKTRAVFGDYVSVYNFRQAIQDGTTVPLYYENRIPELQLTNPHYNEDVEALIAAADLDEAQQEKLDRELARAYHLITRDDRLDKIAQDIVAHFMGRGQPGKAMVVSIDKATAVRIYDKVTRYWQLHLDRLRAQAGLPTSPATPPLQYPIRDARARRAASPAPSSSTPFSGPATVAHPAAAAPLSLRGEGPGVRPSLLDQIAYMESTDMAVVVSQSQNEVEDFRAKGLDILPHRRRMLREDLETRFKDPSDPLRIVFVCAMWMTGFDVPSLTTIYLDKPMRNHTLMQTIARANRVFGDKTNGLIVDYIGIFRDLQAALAIYGADLDTGDGGDEPIGDKTELVALLRGALDETAAFCLVHCIDPDALIASRGADRLQLLAAAVEALVANDETKTRFLALAAQVAKLYRAILPDPEANTFTPAVVLYTILARQIAALDLEADISGVMAAIEKLLDDSIAAEGYVIEKAAPYAASFATDRRVDLRQIDFEAIRRRFEQGHKHTEAEWLRHALSARIKRLVGLNKTRVDYLARLQELIAAYNAGSINVEIFFERLMALAQDLSAEERRAVAENLTEEELALFDLLTRPGPNLSPKEQEQVKTAARDLLTTLKREKLVLDWRKKQQTRADVLVTIKDVLDHELPPAYTPDLYEQKCAQLYDHIYEAYPSADKGVYAAAS